MDTYRIKVKGILEDKWSDWFDSFSLSQINKEETLMVGQVRDQGALHGLLSKIRDLGLTLLLVERVQEESKKYTKD
jgi:hypothetical protein